MAILIRNGDEIFYKGYEIWKPEYQKKAKEFDKYISKEIKKIEKKVFDLGFMKKGGLKDAKCHYWLGKQFKKIKYHESLNETDRPWVIEALEFHAPYPNSPISGKNRDKVNRRAYNYDMLLAEIPEKEIDILKWGEWSTIFDTHAFHNDKRAMKWLKENLTKIENLKKRKVMRKFAPTMNSEFCKTNRDLSYLTDEEFLTEINNVFNKFLKENANIIESNEGA